MTTSIVEHVVFSDGPSVNAVRHLLARLGKVVGSKGFKRWMFRSDCVPFETLMK